MVAWLRLPGLLLAALLACGTAAAAAPAAEPATLMLVNREVVTLRATLGGLETIRKLC